MKTKVKALKIAQSLIGRELVTNKHGHAGRQLENIVEVDGRIRINRGHGVDIPELGLEIKGRELTATSAHTIADMHVNDIINTDYKNSHVFEKFQQQFRVHTLCNVVVSAEVYDFSHESIQDLIEAAYNHAKEQLIKHPDLDYTSYTGFYGYFEKVAGHTTHSFRLSNTDMKKLEEMTKSTFKNLFVSA